MVLRRNAAVPPRLWAGPGHLGLASEQAARTAFVIAGFHRSGTSALARVLNLLGVELGDSLLPPRPDNVKGFWENARIVDVHDRLLAALQSAWHDGRPLPDGWWRTAAVEPFALELKTILDHDLAGAALVGVKDPRIGRLLPLWNQILPEGGFRPVVVLIARHPEEVAASLEKRDGLSRPTIRRLWTQDVLETVANSNDQLRVFVTFEQLLEDWRGVASRIAETAGITWPRKPEEVGPEVESFLEPSLRDHRAGVEPPHESLLRTTYQELSNAAQGGTPRGLQERRASFRAATELFEPLLAEQTLTIAHCSRRVEQATAQFQQHERALAELRAALAERQSRIGELEKHLDSAQQQLDGARQQLDSSRQLLDSSRQQLDSTRQQSDEQRLQASAREAALNKDLSASDARRREVEAELRTLQGSAGFQAVLGAKRLPGVYAAYLALKGLTRPR
jgi:hypothetical protein